MIWLAMILTGAGSYLLRVLPLVVLPHMTLSPRVERAVRHAGLAAITALLVSALTRRVETGDFLPTFVAVGVGLVLTVRGAAMLRVVATGGLTYVAVLAVLATMH